MAIFNKPNKSNETSDKPNEAAEYLSLRPAFGAGLIKAGMTLVEVIVFIAIFSLLLSGFMSYIYLTQDRNISLLRAINDAYARE